MAIFSHFAMLAYAARHFAALALGIGHYYYNYYNQYNSTNYTNSLTHSFTH